MSDSLPVFTFHALDDQPSAISVSPQVFRRGMAKLYENGYRTLSLLEAVSYMRRGEPFPDRSFVITFDDGYKSVFCEAFSVLQRFGMSATVFLTVGKKKISNSADQLPTFEGRSMLSWREIQEMRQAGIDFGAHTLTHPDLSSLPIDQLKAEICESKNIIENVLSSPVKCFAYPYGRYNEKSRKIVQDHFTCACTDKLGLISIGSDTLALERIDAYYLRTDRLFNLIFSRFFPLYVSAVKIPRGIRRKFVLA
jgi:peptidoglycan/xylan/chitin deacetylase (PgdA/CDA1 family)